ICTAGSRIRKVSNATSRPASTQSALTRNWPRARASAGTVAVVVMSPDAPRSSASARRTVSRYDSTSRCWSFITRDDNRARLAAGDLESLHAKGRPQVGFHVGHQGDGAGLGGDRHLGNGYLERLLGFGALLPHLEENGCRPLVRSPIVVVHGRRDLL